MPPHFRYLIRDYPLLVLTQMDMPSKIHSLASVHLARTEYAAPAYRQDAYSTPMNAHSCSIGLDWIG